MQFHLDISEKHLQEKLSWNTTIKEDRTLKSLARREHKYIMRELDAPEIPKEGRFVKSTFKGSSNAEEDSEHLYVYDF